MSHLAERLVAILSYFPNISSSDRTKLSSSAEKWMTELDQAFLMRKKKMGNFVSSVQYPEPYEPPQSGFASFKRTRDPPLIQLLRHGVDVDEEKAKVKLSPAYRLPFLGDSESCNLTSMWLGLLSPKFEPPTVEIPEPPPIKEENMETPTKARGADLSETLTLRDRVMLNESQKPTLVGEYRMFAARLAFDESNVVPGPSTYVNLSWKAGALVIAHTLQQRPLSVTWTHEIKCSLFAKFPARFQEKFPSMVMLGVHSPQTLKDFSKKATDVFGGGVEVKKSVDALLANQLTLKKPTETFIMVGKCFAKCKIAGLKQAIAGERVSDRSAQGGTKRKKKPVPKVAKRKKKNKD